MKELKKFAVIGSPIEHSLSPKIHSLFAESLGIKISYEALKVEEVEFTTRVRQLFDEGYDGLNVTLPLKESAFKFADSLSDDSILCESVNTLWMEDGSICADTTDGRGLMKDLLNKQLDVKDAKILLLGAGGSAKAIIPALLRNNPESITIANRTRERAEYLADRFSSPDRVMKAIPLSAEIDFEPDLIINTSSAGVLDQGMQLPSNIFSSQPSIYDLSYATSNTPFMNLALSSGSKNCYDGIGMLIEQAALSFQIWTNEVPDTDSVSYTHLTLPTKA